MNTPASDLDTLPWYRQFWPWFIFSLPASVVVAGLVTLYIANRHADDLVVDDYYKDGLAINRQLEKKHRAEQLGISATLHFDAGSVMVTLDPPLNIEALSLALSHPLEADRDFIVQLSPGTPGVYSALLSAPVAARWHWTLEYSGPPTWRLDGSIKASDIFDESAD